MTNPYLDLEDSAPVDLQRERELRLAQKDAQQHSPEAAALAARRAEEQDIPFAAAARQETPDAKNPYDWSEIEAESPILARSLREDPAFAAAAQDDLENLSWWEKWFGGWRDMAWETKEGWKRGGGDTVRMAPAKSVGGGGDEPVRVEGGLPEHVPGQGTVQLGIIGWMDMNGQATPELLQTAEDIEKEQAANPPAQLGLIPGIPAAAAESLPLMLRGLLDMPERAMEGAALGLPGGPKGAAAGFAVGARLGMAESAGRVEAGLAWLEYKKIPNVDLKTAKVAAMMVGIANGTLEMAAFGVILKRFPVLEKVFASGGKATKDIFRKILGDNTKRAAFARLVARFGEAGLVEGSTEFVQELNTIIGGVAAGDETMTVEKALARAWEAGVKGAQGGLGMAGPGVTLNLVQDVQGANNAIRRGQFYTALGEKAAESKLRLRLPKVLEQHLDRLQREAGGPIEKMSLPAQVLKKLFQQEGVSDERVARDMPDVAKQLAEAESNTAVEVSIPTAQFAVHIAPLKGFATVQEDIRAGNGMTIREAKVVQDEAKKILEEQKPGKDGEEKTLSPAGKVFNDVLVKLKNAGHDESSARTDAAIWAAVSASRAARGAQGAKDAWEYYEKQTLEVGHEELGGAAVTNFTDALGKLRANPPEKVAQDPAALVRVAARRSLGERFSAYRVLSPAESQSVDAGGALAAGRAFLAGADALAEAARTGGRAVGVALTPEDLTEVNEKGEVRVGQLAKERVTAQPVTLGQMSPEATALAERVAAALETVDGPAPGAEVALPPHTTTLFQIERDQDGKPVRDADGNYFPAWKKKTTKWMEKNGYTAKEIEAHLAAVNAQMSIFAALGPVQIDLLPRGARERGLSDVPAKKGPIRKNIDPIYKVTFDASAMCVKRLEAAATQSFIETKLHRSLTASERLALIALFKQAGKTAPCIYCYVEAPRGKGGDFMAKALAIATGEQDIPGHWKAAAITRAKAAREHFKKAGLTAKDIDPTFISDPARAASKAGQRAVATHAAIYDFLEQQYNYAKANKVKLYEEYNGQILELKDELLEELNRYAGFRFFSTSDFQAEHVIDLIQAFRDLTLRGAKAHAYTKVRDFVEIFGGTGMKIQTSIFAKPDGKGGFVEDAWQGMAWKDAQELRAKFGNVGSVLVATSDEMVTWALDQPWVDYIIPFHYSGLEKKYYETMEWQDFTAHQNEKSLVKGVKAKKIRMHELGAEGGLSNEEMSKAYKKLAAERKLKPVFAKWAEHPQFAKLKKDYARTDTAFVPVDASKIDMTAVGRVLETVWKGTAPKEQVDKLIAEQLLQLIKAKPEDVGVTALSALERGQDIGTAVRESKLKVLKQEERRGRPAPNPAAAQVKSAEFSPGMTEHFFTVPGTPFRLTVDEEEDIEGTNRMHVRVLSLKDEKGTPEDQLIEAWKGQGHSTALYLRALMEAQKRGLGFDSDFIRSNATNEMYPRLTRLGVPFELIARPGLGETDDTLYRISAEALAAVDLQAAWEQLVREGVTKAELKLRSLGQKGRGAPGLKKGPTTRGYITFDETRKWFNITETKDRNLSTFLHESGHAFLELLQRDAESGHAGSQEDLRILREWLGAPVGQPFTDEQLETFARGFEAYLMEGKAPSEELRGVFATVKAWMKSIYQTIQALNAPLSDEVRGVFDRLLASDEAIESARRKSMLVPMFEGDAKVRDMWDRAIAEATGNLEQEAIQTRRRAVKNDLERVQNEVDEEVAADRDYNAWEVLSGRDRLDGATVPPELKGKKLDREAVRALSLGGQVNRKLQSVSTTEAKDLISLDEAAGFLGYANGLELVKALGGLEGRAKHVKSEVTRRMTELYPGYDANAAWLEEQALEELHSGEDVALALLAELEAVGKHVNGKAPPRSVLEAVKLAAQDRAAQLTYLELDPERYRRAEATAGRLAQEAYGSKKLEEAYDAKRQQLWNHFMYREVLKARKEMDRIRDYLAKFDDLATRKKIGLAGQNYLEAIDALLDALDLKRRSMKSLRRAKSLAAYLAEMDAAGEPVAIPADLRDETQLRLKNYKNRTVSDMKAVEAAARNLEHLAQMKNKLRLGKDLREFKDLTGGLSAHIEAKAGSKFMEKMGDPQNPGWWEKKRRWLRKSGAYLKKMEFIARALDGGDIAGFAHQTIFQPFANAEKLEVEMKTEIVQRLHDLFDGMTWAERRRYDQEVDFLGTPMRMRDVLAVALNMGNAGNLERLIRGYAYRGWTEENVKARLDELLTNKDIALVEEIWKTIDSLWPHIVKLQEKFIGIAPEKVDPRPVLLPSGRRMSGGYYPIVKDRDRSHLAEKIAERKEGAWENNFMSPVVEHGFTRQRGAEMSPLLLDLSVVPSHLSEVIHYVTHYEAVRAVDRLTQNGEVRAAITNALGKETYLEIRPWLEGIAADGKVLQLSPLDQVLRHLRFGSSIVLYGFKVATGSVQALGMYTTAKDIGAKYAVRGAIRFARELAHGRPWPEDSFEVTNIMLHSDRDVAQLLETGLSAFGTFGQLKADMVHFSMSWMMLVQKTVNSMAYYGAYEKALEDGHPDPVAYAESVVRMTQSAAGVKDLAAIQRSPEAVRMFAVAYSYFSVLFNQLGQPLPPGKRLPELAARWWWLVFLPVITEAWLRNRRPEDGDEPEDWLKFFAAEQFLYVSRTVPFWSAISESFISEKEARTAPWISATLRGAAALGKATLEDRPLSPTDKKALLNLVGTVGHLPSAATVNAARYLEEFSSGSMDEPVRNLLFRSPGQFE